MKRKIFIPLFIGTHILFIFLQIYKHSQVIKLSYKKQKNEADRQLLAQKKQDLTHQLYALKNRSAIKKFAMNHLNMKKITLKQIKKINDNE